MRNDEWIGGQKRGPAQWKDRRPRNLERRNTNGRISDRISMY